MVPKSEVERENYEKNRLLGAGNMAKAIINGLIAANLYEPAEILVYNHRYEPTLAQLEKETDHWDN